MVLEISSLENIHFLKITKISKNNKNIQKTLCRKRSISPMSATTFKFKKKMISVWNVNSTQKKFSSDSNDTINRKHVLKLLGHSQISKKQKIIKFCFLLFIFAPTRWIFLKFGLWTGFANGIPKNQKPDDSRLWIQRSQNYPHLPCILDKKSSVSI